MKPTRAECHDLLMDIMNRLDAEKPEAADQLSVLFGHRFDYDPSVPLKHAVSILVPLLTPYEAARLHALMENPTP